MPLMVRLSVLAVPMTLKVTVIVELETERLRLLMGMSRLLELMPPAPALKRQPLGAVKISVTFVPFEKSVIAPSWITILPKVVNAGTAPFWALSAETEAPPVPAVILTLANALSAQSHRKMQDKNRVRYTATLPSTSASFIVFKLLPLYPGQEIQQSGQATFVFPAKTQNPIQGKPRWEGTYLRSEAQRTSEFQARTPLGSMGARWGRQEANSGRSEGGYWGVGYQSSTEIGSECLGGLRLDSVCS